MNGKPVYEKTKVLVTGSKCINAYIIIVKHGINGESTVN